MSVIRELSLAARRAVCGCAFGLILLPAFAVVRGRAGAPLGALFAGLSLALALAGFCLLTYWIDGPRLRKAVPPWP